MSRNCAKDCTLLYYSINPSLPMVSQKLLKKTTSLPPEKYSAHKYEKMVYKKVTERKRWCDLSKDRWDQGCSSVVQYGMPHINEALACCLFHPSQKGEENIKWMEKKKNKKPCCISREEPDLGSQAIEDPTIAHDWIQSNWKSSSLGNTLEIWPWMSKVLDSVPGTGEK